MMTLRLIRVKDNSAQIARIIAKRKAEWLEQFGKDVDDQARLLQQESNAPSQPGQPPHVHSPEPNLETIEYEVDLANDSVRVGPVFLPQSRIRPALPGVMEKGGKISVRHRARGGKTVIVHQYVKARPVMIPAAERAIEKFKNDIRKRGIR